MLFSRLGEEKNKGCESYKKNDILKKKNVFFEQMKNKNFQRPNCQSINSPALLETFQIAQQKNNNCMLLNPEEEHYCITVVQMKNVQTLFRWK